MTEPDKDHRSDNATFRDQVLFYYTTTKVLPCSADLIATHYMSAIVRERTFDADRGPVLAGCEKFGPEVSPRVVIETHTRAKHANLRKEEFLDAVEYGLSQAELEITSPVNDVFGRRYQPTAFHY
jgi:hypothetical protein